MKIVHNPGLRDFVEKNLYDDQSPPNISGRIKSAKDTFLPFPKTVFTDSSRVPTADESNIIETNEKAAAGGDGLKEAQSFRTGHLSTKDLNLSTKERGLVTRRRTSLFRAEAARESS